MNGFSMFSSSFDDDEDHAHTAISFAHALAISIRSCIKTKACYKYMRRKAFKYTAHHCSTHTNKSGHKHQSNAKRMETILRGGASFLFIRWNRRRHNVYTHTIAHQLSQRLNKHTHRTENQPCQLIAWNAWHFVTFDDLTRMWWFYTKTSPFFLQYTLIHFLSISLFLSPFFPWLLSISLLYLYLVCTAFVCTPIVIGYNTFYMLELEYNGNSFQP